jgi:four helix bundle protein
MMNERNMNKKPNPLKEKSFQFALKIIQLSKFLSEEKREYIMSKQLMRSGTSIGANIREGQNAQSKADFIHKFSIAQKECDETLYWLELLQQSRFLQEKEFTAIHNDANELLKMLRSSILTSKQNIHNS